MITEICLVVLALCTPVLACFAYRQGVKDSLHTNTMPPTEKPAKPIKCNAQGAQNTVTDYINEANRVLYNIETYDGTGIGQRKAGE